MKTMKTKWKSSKMWIAIAGIAIGVATIMGADANQIQTVAGAVVSLFSVATYIIAEGKVDAAGVAKAITATENAIQAVAGDPAADTPAPTDAAEKAAADAPIAAPTTPTADPAQSAAPAMATVNVSTEVAAALNAAGVVVQA